MNFRIFLAFAVGCLVPALAVFDFEAFRAAGGQALSWDTRSLVSTAEYPCPNEGFFVHPKNCSRFYRCVDFTNESLIFSRYLFECPEGNVFAQTIEACIPGVCPDGIQSLGQVGSGDGSTVGTDSSPSSVDTSGSVVSSGAVDSSGAADNSGTVDSSGSTDGSSQVEATDVATGQSPVGASAGAAESGMEQGGVTNPSDAPMPDPPVSTSLACSADKPYKQKEDYCNIFYKCGFPEELYACNTGTAFHEEKQMCRLTAFEEKICEGKKVFIVSAIAFRDGFRWNDVAVFPSVFPVVANAIPFTFSNLRAAVTLEDTLRNTEVKPLDIPTPVSSTQADNSALGDFGLSELQETIKKLKEETESLQVAGFLGDSQDSGIYSFNSPSFQQSILGDSNDFGYQFKTDPFAQEQSSFNEPILGAVDTTTGEVFAAVPVGENSPFPDLTMRNSFAPFSQLQSSPEFGGLVSFLKHYNRSPSSLSQQQFAHPSLYGSSQNKQTSYRPFASVVEYIPFSFNQASSPSTFTQAGSTYGTPFSISQPNSPFSSNYASSPFSFNQASSPFSFNQASSTFYSKPSPQFSFNQASSPFFSRPSSPFSFNQAGSSFFPNSASSQFSFEQQLPSSQFTPGFPLSQISSPQLFRLPTPQLPFYQQSSPFDLNSLLNGGVMSNFNAEKAAEDFVNQYFAAAILENNKNDKKDETGTIQSVESTPGQVSFDTEALEKLMSGQGSASGSAFGIPSLDSIIERPAIHGVAARNREGELFHVIPVNEHELAFLKGIEGLQSRGLDSSLEIVPLTDELLSQMQVGDAILASWYKKK